MTPNSEVDGRSVLRIGATLLTAVNAAFLLIDLKDAAGTRPLLDDAAALVMSGPNQRLAILVLTASLGVRLLHLTAFRT